MDIDFPMNLLPFGLSLFLFYFGGTTHTQFKVKIPAEFTEERSAGLTTKVGQAHNTSVVTTVNRTTTTISTTLTTTTSGVGHPRK